MLVSLVTLLTSCSSCWFPLVTCLRSNEEMSSPEKTSNEFFFPLLAYIVWLSRSFIHSSVYVIPPAHILHTDLLQQVPACYFVFHAKSCMLVLRCQEKFKNSFRLKEHTCSMMQCGMHSSVHKSLISPFYWWSQQYPTSVYWTTSRLFLPGRGIQVGMLGCHRPWLHLAQ